MSMFALVNASVPLVVSGGCWQANTRIQAKTRKESARGKERGKGKR